MRASSLLINLYACFINEHNFLYVVFNDLITYEFFIILYYDIKSINFTILVSICSIVHKSLSDNKTLSLI